MSNMHDEGYLAAQEILEACAPADRELARELLGLRQEPSAALHQHVRLLLRSTAEQQATVRQRRLARWHRRLRLAVFGAVALIFALLTLVNYLPASLRSAPAQAVELIGRILAGSIYTSDGSIMFTPAPSFTVLQPKDLSASWELIGDRYNTGSVEPGTLSDWQPVGEPAGSARQAITRDRGRGAYVVLGYEAPGGAYLALFERVAQPSDLLPAGEQRAVGGQAAMLLRSNLIVTLVWVSEGTWIELESNLPESELLKVAESLTVSQRPGPQDPAATPSGVESTFMEIPRLTVEEAQQQVNFHIPTLAWLPPGFKLGGAHVMPPDWANVFYVPTDPELVAAQAGLGVAIRRGSDTTTRSYSGARVQEDIMVHGRAASYIAGPAFGLLTWEAGGFSYDLSYSGVELSREDVQRLAESLR
jgi:hypothetical protein